MIARLFDKFFDRLVRDAFPGVEPVKFAYGRAALGPLRTELLGLKRNHARDEIRLNQLCEAWHMSNGHVYYFDSIRRRPPDSISRIEHKQRVRTKRMDDIVAKLARDGRMKAPKQTTPGTA